VIAKLVLFGATGDLAGRYLLPALAALFNAGRLPDDFELVGAAREDHDDDAFRRLAAARLEEHAADVPSAARHKLLDSLRYRRVELHEPSSIAQVIGGDELEGAGSDSTVAVTPVAVYLALPADLFPVAVTALKSLGLPEGSRIVLEKPFGEDLESAVALNRLLAEVAGDAGEQAVFRVDHFLGLATVQNLLGMRLVNRVVEPIWNSTQIEQVDIVWEETLALEGRAAYYDKAGQLKDMVQNHLLQVLCLIAMELPAGPGERELRDSKLDILRSVRPLSAADVASRTRRARYTAGRIGDRAIPAYVDEAGVDATRNTETFAEVVLELDNARWAGTRFVLRTGKAMARNRMEVVVRFRAARTPPRGDVSLPPAPNELRLGLAVEHPNDITLRLTASGGESPPELMPLMLAAELPAQELREYSRVLLEVLAGGSSLSIRGDEAEQAWRLLTPVLDAWNDDEVALEEYPAGSDGPAPRPPATGPEAT